MVIQGGVWSPPWCCKLKVDLGLDCPLGPAPLSRLVLQINRQMNYGINIAGSMLSWCNELYFILENMEKDIKKNLEEVDEVFIQEMEDDQKSSSTNN